MKQRFSALDVSAQVAELRQRLVGLRLQNIYDINPRTYLFKFSRPDHKELILVESGIRFHSTEFARDKSLTPSHFAMKLRRHLRTRRLNAFDQLGADRVVDMRFGEGETAYHIIAEFYASGNIILTDYQYKILALLRTVELEGPASASAAAGGDGETRFAVGEIYDVTRAKTFEGISEQKIREALISAISESENVTEKSPAPEPPTEGGKLSKGWKAGKKKGASKATNKEKKKNKDSTLRKAIREKLGQDYGPALVEHCLLESGLDGNMRIDSNVDLGESSAVVRDLLDAFKHGDEIVRSCMGSSQKGWIVLRDISRSLAGSGKVEGQSKGVGDRNPQFLTYDEFHPYLFSQFSGLQASSNRINEYPTFDKAVDEFFSKLEAQKLEARARQAELGAAKKLESVKAGHLNQVRGLEVLQEESAKIARAIEANLSIIESLINTFRSFIASGMDWTDLEEMVKEEKKNGNPVAAMVLRLKLDVGMVTVILRDPDVEDSDEETDASETDSEQEDEDTVSTKASTRKNAGRDQDDRFLKADLDIYSSAYANARRYYDAKKTAAVKQEKTLQAAEKALKSAERKIEQDLKSVQQVAPAITKMRKPYWFEKFIWFISSENYLVVGGRDAGQNEILVRRYLKKGDIYVHADLHGAASVIVKNVASPGDSDAPVEISPTTLHQAGTMSVCQSRAWDAKIVTSAWWVYDHQVSKTAPSGEYLSTGSFMIRGKKNFLPPVQLVYGFGVLFKVDESSAGRHYWERRPWGRGGDESNAGAVKGEVQEENQSNRDSGEAVNKPDEPGEPTEKVVVTEPLEYEQGNVQGVKVSNESLNVDKYGLGAREDNVEEDEDEPVSVEPASGSQSSERQKKYLSAKERRDIKKQTRVAGSSDDSPQSTPPSNRSVKSGKQNAKDQMKTLPLEEKPQAVRGKKGKIKKLKDKYQDQDEEDRALMLELLGSNKGPQPKGKKAKAEAEAAKKQAELQNRSGSGRQKQESQRPQGIVETTDGSTPDYPSGRDADAGNRATKTKEGIDGGSYQAGRESTASDSAEVQRMLEEENVALVPEEETNFSFLDTLTGQPDPADILLNAIPVCAPWSALQRFKYKVKLIPGSMKKGKATKSALGAFVSIANEEESRNTPKPSKNRAESQGSIGDVDEDRRVAAEAAKRQRELIKSLSEMECMQAMLGKVKVNADVGKKGKGAGSGSKKGKGN